MISPPRAGNTSLLMRIKDKHIIANKIKLNTLKNRISNYYDELTKKEISVHKPIKYWINSYPDKWKNYYKFGFCRNPYDRIISWWFTCKNHNYPEGRKSLKDFILHRKGSNQLKYMTDNIKLDGKIMLDEILRFENYEEELQRISKKLGFKLEENKNIRGTKRKHYSYYYDDECRQLIKKFFGKELELWNYQFENTPSEYSKWCSQDKFIYKNNFYYKI